MADHTQTEGSSGVYTASLVDESGQPVTNLNGLRVWLRDVLTGTIINSRDGQSLLDDNNGTFAAGLLTWAMQAADHPVLNHALPTETHEAVFLATWTGGAKSWKRTWDVENFRF